MAGMAGLLKFAEPRIRATPLPMRRCNIEGPSSCRTWPMPLHRLADEMTTLMLAEFDAETRFQLRAQRGTGKAARGLALLKKAAG